MCKLLNEKSFLFAALLLSAVSMSCSKDPDETDKPNKPDDHNIIEWGDSTLSGDATMGEMMMFRVGDSLQVIRKASTRLSTAFDGQNYTLSGDERITIALKRSDNSVEGPKIYKVKNALTGALEYVKDADNNVTEPFYWKSKSETVKLRAWSYGTSTDYTTNPVGNAFSLNTDQREATGQDNYQELLYTPEFECKYTDHSGSASINLYHQMTRLTIDLTHLATGDLSVNQVTIGDGTLPTTAKFSETGIDTGNGDYIGSWEEPTVAEGTPGYVIARADQNNKKYSAVLFPRTYAAGTKLVTIKTTNGDFAYKIPAGDGLPLDPGKQYAYTISVTDLVETSTLSISDIDACTYDGTAQEPHPIVKYGDKVLTEGTHYTLSWSNNINAGTATCTVTGKDGSIFKNSQDKNFTINKKVLTAEQFKYATTSKTETYIWDLVGYSNTLTNTEGATVEYTSSNPNLASVNSSTGVLTLGTTAGTTTITATATGNYSGTASYTVTATYNYKDFDYTNGVQSVTLPKGTYKLEVWGAQGANATSTYVGGKGAYVVGTLSLANTTTLNVYVGQQGTTDGTDAWNGGGHQHASTWSGMPACGGGGATDISLSGDSSWKTDSHLYSRIIVAGGGGGGLYWKEGATTAGNVGGAGGAWNGGAGSGSDPGTGGTLDGPGENGGYVGGTRTSAGFGYGGSMDFYHNDTWKYEAAGAGGGGWYGGGYAGFANLNGSGGGGSSYAWTTEQNLYQKYPASTYKPSTTYYLTGVNATAGSRSGNGAAKITWVSN